MPAIPSASWITLPGGKAENVTFLARRKFKLSEIPESATIRVSADYRYALYLNGKFVGHGPVKGSHRRYFYDTYDVTPLLRAGENTIAAEVHSPGRATFSAVPVMPSLFVDGIVKTDDAWQVRSDPSHRNDGPLYTSQMGFADWRDLRRERIGWQTFADSPEGWIAAEIIDGIPGGRSLVPCDISRLTRDRHSPKRLIACGRVPVAPKQIEDDPLFGKFMQAEGHDEEAGVACLEKGSLSFAPTATGSAYAILDFERENFGTMYLDIEAKEGTILDLGYGDALYEGRVKTSAAGGYLFADRYLLRAGRQRIEHYLHDRGFRYCQLVVRRFNEPVRIHSLEVADRAYPIPVRAEFTCDDPFLNRLWKMCAETLAVCSTDTFVDCPWREQALWVCDTLVVYPFYFAFTGEKELPARCLRLSADGQRANGLIPSVYPSAEVEHSTFPSMPAIWTLMLGDHYFYTGDAALVRELLPIMDKALAIYAQWAGPDGLVPNQSGMWNFIEWGSPGSRPDAKPHGTTTILNMLIAAAYKAASSLCEAVGDSTQAAEWKKKERQLVTAVADRLWVPERERFCDGTELPKSSSQHPHAVGLHYGLLEEPQREQALNALLDPTLIQTDFYYQHFVLNALAQGGHEAEALAVIRKLWNEMVASDSPTIWETSKGKEEFDGAGSLCHAFACAPLYFMQTVLLGVRPLRPAFAEFSLDPKSLGLDSARGTVPTPRGLISVAWEKQKNDALSVELKIPAATTAVLPDGSRLASGNHSLTLQPLSFP